MLLSLETSPVLKSTVVVPGALHFARGTTLTGERNFARMRYKWLLELLAIRRGCFLSVLEWSEGSFGTLCS